MAKAKDTVMVHDGAQILEVDLQTLVEIIGLIGAAVATVVGLYISLVIKITKLQIGLDILRKDINNLGRAIKGRM